jgi:hypothetical protein
MRFTSSIQAFKRSSVQAFKHPSIQASKYPSIQASKHPGNTMASFIKSAEDHQLVWMIENHLPSTISYVKEEYFSIDRSITDECKKDQIECGEYLIDLFETELQDAKEELLMREYDRFSCFEEKIGKPRTREGKRAEKRVGMRAERK